MPLDSSSSDAEILAAYQDNACYEEEGNVTKAKAFLTACRCLLLILPKRAAHGGRGAEEIELSTDLIQQQLADCRQWLALHDTSNHPPRVRHLSLESFRG